MSSHQKFMSLGIDVSVLSLLSAFKIKIDTIDKGTKTCHRQLKAYVNANVCRHPSQQKLKNESRIPQNINWEELHMFGQVKLTLKKKL